MEARVAVTATGFAVFAFWRHVRASGWIIGIIWAPVYLTDDLTRALAGAGLRALALAAAIAVALVVAGALALAVTVPVVGAVAVAVAVVSVVALAHVVAIAVTVAGLLGFSFAFALSLILALALALAVAVAVSWLNETAARKGRCGIFLILFFIAITLACLVATYALASFRGWHHIGPLLLFVGMLTLLNAPFDWASLGLTRALLRRGLELGGWWPYFLALVDALAAAFIIALLAITMVIGVQTFDHLAEHSGGPDARVLPLDKLFDGIAAHPSAPEYWWAYALLLSTMIPSLLNLMIGGASLLRGVPGLPALLLRFMPAGKAVPVFDRTWLALVLTCQVFVGAFLGIAAQFALAIGVMFYLLPWMGLELLDTARAVAEFDLPMRVLRLWWGDQP